MEGPIPGSTTYTDPSREEEEEEEEKEREGEQERDTSSFFCMKDTIQCKQYTMAFRDLKEICTRKGLRLIYFNDLRTCYETEVLNPKNAPIMERMKIVDTNLSGEDGENASMYCTFVFVKMKVHRE